MKLFKKPKSLFIVLVITLLCLCVGVGATGAEGVFYNRKNRKVPIYSVDRDDKKISISFDCAWGVEHTDKLLEVMEKYKVKCTFFTVKFWTEKHSDYVEKIFKAGHEIGTHSSTHKYMSKLSEEQIIDEINSSKEAIEKITGQKVKLFRPPYGDYNDRLISCVDSLGLKTVQWSVDSLDWKDLSADKIVERVVKRVQSGSIILCHNNGLHTAEALPKIFEVLQSQGYEFVPISELIYQEGYTIDINGIQRK